MSTQRSWQQSEPPSHTVQLGAQPCFTPTRLPAHFRCGVFVRAVQRGERVGVGCSAASAVRRWCGAACAVRPHGPPAGLRRARRGLLRRTRAEGTAGRGGVRASEDFLSHQAVLLPAGQPTASSSTLYNPTAPPPHLSAPRCAAAVRVPLQRKAGASSGSSGGESGVSGAAVAVSTEPIGIVSADDFFVTHTQQQQQQQRIS